MQRHRGFITGPGSSQVLPGLILCLFLGWAPTSHAQEDGGQVDVVLRVEVTAEYEAYLASREAELGRELEAGDVDDVSRMALVLVKLGQMQVAADRAGDRIDAATEDRELQLDELGEVLRDEITGEDTQSLESLLRAVRERFVEDIDADLEKTLDDIFDRIEADNEEINSALEDLAETVGERGDEAGDLLMDLNESEADFLVTFRITGGPYDEADVFEISRRNMDDVGQTSEALFEAGGELFNALETLDEAETTADNAAAIAAMREAVAQLDRALEIVQEALAQQPFDLLGRELGLIGDIDGAAEGARGWLGDIDEILAGRTFEVGDMLVRPVSLIESRTESARMNGDLADAAIVLSLLARRQFAAANDRDSDAEWYDLLEWTEDAAHSRLRAEKARLAGWVGVMLTTGSVGLSASPTDLFREFYSADAPETHTFRGYFPGGLSGPMLEIIGADMIVNTNASRGQLDDHLVALREGFRERVEEYPMDAEARTGLALIRTYFLVADNQGDVEEAIDMVLEGDIASLVERFDLEEFDYSESLDSTRTDLDTARMDEDMVFILLDKLNEDEESPFEITEGDDILPIPLTGKLLGRALDLVEILSDVAAIAAEAVSDLLGEAREFVELDLDPNQLDFAEAESGLDFALALERSNDRLLQITPSGHDRLQSAGDDLSEQLGELSETMHEMRLLMVSLDDHEDVEVGGVADAMVDLDDLYKEVHADFESPAGYTEIDGEAVNLSAWFDTPPDSLLQRFIWYLDEDANTDNTLGGLLPKAGVGSAVVETRTPALPEKLRLEQNYPNPFNSSTTIRFELPRQEEIRLVLYNVAGQRVADLVDGVREAGVYTVRWDGRDESGNRLASGVYVYRLESGAQVEIRRLVLVQ